MAGDEEAIVGIHPVSEALAAGEPISAVVVARHRERDAALKDLIAAAHTRKIALNIEPESWFRRFGTARHQHVAAIVAPFAYTDWRELRARLAGVADALVVVSDHIEDPQNLGAIIRTAEAAGAHGLVIPDRRGASITAGARRAAAGSASHLAVSRVPNLVRVLEDLKSDGHWVTGLATDSRTKPYTLVDYRGKCAVVIGGEGKGLSRLVSEHCDHLVKIPMHGKVASLNASVACAVVLYEIVRQRDLACENANERKVP